MKEQPECEVDEHGNKWWRFNGKWHREDGPAYEGADGDKRWVLNGEYHREDGPAVERTSGTKEWLLHGQHHREDGPALEWANGYKKWYLNGEEAHPETLVDLHLSRGTFCYYDQETETLHFDEST